MNAKVLPILAAVLLLPAVALAQQGTISGTVVDAQNGDTLPGATVLIPSLQKGSATGPGGKFQIRVEPGEYTIQASFVGYKDVQRTVSVSAGATTTIRFQLTPVESELSEVVVTAQQIERQRRSLGYSVSNIETESVTNTSESNLVKQLSGDVSGVSITTQSGNVGGGARILLRGLASLSGNNQPLFVVDGAPVSNSNNPSGSRLVGTYDTGNKAGQLNPSSIKSISVLKGASAAALYGQQAKNGVVLIETKSGAGQPATVTYNASMTWSRPTVLPDFQNKYAPGDQGRYDSEDLDGWGPRMKGQTVKDFRDSTTTLTPNPDNVSNFYNRGSNVRHNLSFSNSGEFGNFRVGLSTDQVSGIVPNSELNRYNLNGNFGTSTLDGRVNVDLSANYVKENTQGRQAAGGNDPNVLVGIINNLPRNLSNKKLENNFQTDAGNQIPLGPNTNNPYWVAQKNVFTTDVERFFGSAKIGFEVTDWLTLREQIGADIISEQRRERNRKTTKGAAKGSFSDQRFRQRTIDHDFTIRTDNQFGDFSLQTILGQSINQETYEQISNTSTNLNIGGLFTYGNAVSNSPSNFFEKRRILGVYGQATVGFRNYAFLTVTGRNDWSSTLPKENRSFFYPSISGSLVFTDLLEKEYDISIPGISYGKLRANYGEVGSDEEPYQLGFDFQPVSTVFGQFGTDIIFPFRGLTGFRGDDTVPPTDLKPQRKVSWEIGTELGLFDGRVNLDFTYYREETQDQILDLPRPPSSGFEALRTNVGTVLNEGIELSVSAGIFTRENFAWRMSGNFTRNQNTVTKLAEGVDELVVQSAFNGLQIQAKPGEEIQFVGVGWARDPNTGKPIVNPTTGLRQAGEDKTFGSPYPDFKVGYKNTITVGPVQLSFLIDWNQGGKVYSSTVQDLRSLGLAKETARNRGGTYIDREAVIVTERGPNGEILETKPNDVPVSSMEAFWSAHSAQNITEAGIFPATYVKLRDVSLTYTLPGSLLERTALSKASISVQGRNLLLLYSQVPHIDPETNLFGSGANIGRGVEFNNLPNTKTLGVKLNVTF